LFKTKAGELTVQAKKFRLLSKALLPLPEKWHGLKDIEERYRKRYLDLIMNPEVKERFVIRSKIVESIRRLLLNKGYLEVETPVLQTIYGGGFAKPFITHHNALDIPLYLRISDELYLKRLLVGHFEKIFEFCRDFRNEGLDPSHNPEFTMLEAMTAYQDYRFSMDLVEEIYETAAKEVLGTTKINYQEHQIDLKRPWKRLTLHQAVKEFTGHDLVKVSDLSEAIEIAAGLKIDKRKIKPLQSVGEITNLIFEEKVESNLIQPVIIYDYPVEVSPLAKKSRTNPKVVERFEHFIFGKEHGNHYSELNDPVELKKRFIEEKNKKEAGFEEAHQTDLDFVEALEHGMPPATGIGIGIDRLAMLFTNSRSIKEVIFFPTMKPKTKSIEENGKAK
ncbi:MAG TPA: lysine--tRNA ligase, partial [Patescibacteria group bacterium]